MMFDTIKMAAVVLSSYLALFFVCCLTPAGDPSNNNVNKVFSQLLCVIWFDNKRVREKSQDLTGKIPLLLQGLEVASSPSYSLLDLAFKGLVFHEKTSIFDPFTSLFRHILIHLSVDVIINCLVRILTTQVALFASKWVQFIVCFKVGSICGS